MKCHTCGYDDNGTGDFAHVCTNAPRTITMPTMTTQTNEQPDTLGSEWAPCRKKPIVVHVRAQRLGEQHVSTREGITPVKPDDLIMRGVAGEEYPIGRELFDRTYDIVDGNEQPAGERAELIRWLRTIRSPYAGKAAALLEADAQRPLKPLTNERLEKIGSNKPWIPLWALIQIVRDTEAAHGIGKGQA